MEYRTQCIATSAPYIEVTPNGAWIGPSKTTTTFISQVQLRMIMQVHGELAAGNWSEIEPTEAEAAALAQLRETPPMQD